MPDMTGQAVAPVCARVSVDAGARLHMGFVDLNGGLGRRYGSLGVGLQNFRTRVDIFAAREMTAIGPDSDRALGYARDFCSRLHLPPVAIEIKESVPTHSGLGSGTQLALAVGMGLTQLYGLPHDIHHIAQIADRGVRSGVGVGVFEQGGFVLDGGRGRRDTVPPVTVRATFPEDWHFILALDETAQGLHGDAEQSAFRRLPHFSAQQAGQLCRLVLMQLLPALSERNLPAFGKAVSEIQAVVGDHFASAQGGRFTSARVANLLDWLSARGATAIGQSSWGPTGFALVGSARRALDLVKIATQELDVGDGLVVAATPARNHAAVIESQAGRSQTRSHSTAHGRMGIPG